ncbi:MAG: FecR domain-containing protein [Akkermansiaceae bacterium]|nr:FecR domain-containing protein [Akkermansiaceae bacterium]
MKPGEFDKKDQEQLLTLIAEVLDGTVDNDSREALNTLLKANPDARKFYRGHMELHARLHLDYTGGAAADGMPVSLPKPGTASGPGVTLFSKQQGVVAAVLAVAACITLIATFAWFQQPEETPVTGEPTEAKPEAESFVTIKQVRAARWESGNLPTSEGARLAAGTMRLTEGLVTLHFDSGAKMNLEAPSELTLIDAMNVQLVKGTVVVDIPESAIGFQVKTPSANVVDFGTRFSVSVAPDTGRTRTQVYEGLVEVQSPLSGEIVSLKTGQRNSVEKGKLGKAQDGLGEPVWRTDDSPDMDQLDWTVIEPTKDAYIGRVVDHESEVFLYLKNGHADYAPHRKAYLGFDLAGIESARIADAELSLHFAPTGWGLASHVPDATFSVYGMLAHDVSWDEDSLSEKNAPANVMKKGAALVTSKVRKLGSFTIEQGVQRGDFGIDGETLTGYLRDHAGSEITLVVVRDTVETEDAGLVHGFASRRHPSLPAPTLSISLSKD